MANNKKNHWYVLVMSDNGPVFVTSVEYSPKVAHWDKDKAPMELDKYRAEDLTLGLNLNFHTAFAVCSKFELDQQPYNYKDWQIEWKERKDEVQEDE